MFVLDTGPTARPWHVYQAALGTGHVMALCSKVLDARPRGLEVRAVAEVNTICGICLVKQQQSAA